MAKEKIDCPVCGISVKIENIENHLKKVHPSKKVEVPEIGKKAKKKKKVAPIGRGRAKRAALGTVLAIAIIIVIAAVMIQSPPSEETPNYAPDFYATNIDGGTYYNLYDHIGPNPILLQFFCTAGAPCVEMAPTMVGLSQHYGDDLEIVSLSLSTVSEIQDFRSTYGGNWVFGHITSQVFDKYGSPGFPHFVVVDKQGIIRYEHTGVLSLDDLKNAIEPWT